MKAILRFAGLTLELHPERLLWIPELRLLCVSDLHFEKGSFFSQFATLLPPYDTQEMLGGLSAAIEQFQPLTFIALGDSFHDREAGQRLDAGLKEQLNGLIARVPRWVWIIGNHDPDIDDTIHGERHEESVFQNVCFRHKLSIDDSGFEISGHFHPKVSVRLKGHSISGACFVQSGKRLIMPSYGGYTGGLSIASAEFSQHMPEPLERIFLSYQGVMHSLPLSLL